MKTPGVERLGEFWVNPPNPPDLFDFQSWGVPKPPKPPVTPPLPIVVTIMYQYEGGRVEVKQKLQQQKQNVIYGRPLEVFTDRISIWISIG